MKLTEAQTSGLIERLRAACIGHPHAKIAWPHHLLHDAADRIAELEAALLPFVDVRDQFPETLKIIQKKLDGLTPIKVTVTKDQFLAGRLALSSGSEKP